MQHFDVVQLLAFLTLAFDTCTVALMYSLLKDTLLKKWKSRFLVSINRFTLNLSIRLKLTLVATYINNIEKHFDNMTLQKFETK